MKCFMCTYNITYTLLYPYIHGIETYIIYSMLYTHFMYFIFSINMNSYIYIQQNPMFIVGTQLTRIALFFSFRFT